MARVTVQQTKVSTTATIPKEIIDYLQLNKGDQLEYRIKDNGEVVVRKA